MSVLGLRMDDEAIHVAAGLRLGPRCHPYRCYKCNADVDHLALHGLSCRNSLGHHPSHAAENYMIKRSLASANMPSHLEYSGIMRSDGKRPDRATEMPWSGRTLVWDATCPDIFALPHVALAAREAGTVASQAESKKLQKCAVLATVTILSSSPSKPLECLGLRLFYFLISWEDGSRLRPGSHICCSPCSRESRQRFSKATWQQCWALHPQQTTFNYSIDTAVLLALPTSNFI